jgi:hypothetical protein
MNVSLIFNNMFKSRGSEYKMRQSFWVPQPYFDPIKSYSNV